MQVGIRTLTATYMCTLLQPIINENCAVAIISSFRNFILIVLTNSSEPWLCQVRKTHPGDKYCGLRAFAKKRNQSRENERAWFGCSRGSVARLFNHAHRTFSGWWWWAHSRSKPTPRTQTWCFQIFSASSLWLVKLGSMFTCLLYTSDAADE